jgi:hypothetical protein
LALRAACPRAVDRFLGGPVSSVLGVRTRADSNEVMDGTRRYVDFAPLREYDGNVPVGAALFSKFRDEFPKRLEARARRLFWERFQNLS